MRFRSQHAGSIVDHFTENVIYYSPRVGIHNRQERASIILKDRKTMILIFLARNSILRPLYKLGLHSILQAQSFSGRILLQSTGLVHEI